MHDRQHLEAEVAEGRRPSHQAACLAGVARGAAAAGDERRSRARSSSAVEAALDLRRPATSEMLPVSSDTTIATASFSSVSADRGAMARAELAAEPRVDRQRQEAGRRRDAIVLHDHGAVVQRRGRLEDAHQQVVGERGVERDAALDVVAQADAAARSR